MTTNITLLPNPFTPLAFLPPVRAGQVQATAYISVGVLSVSFSTYHNTVHVTLLNLGIVMGLADVNPRRYTYVS